jgi:hypothetical protein
VAAGASGLGCGFPGSGRDSRTHTHIRRRRRFRGGRGVTAGQAVQVGDKVICGGLDIGIQGLWVVQVCEPGPVRFLRKDPRTNNVGWQSPETVDTSDVVILWFLILDVCRALSGAGPVPARV